MKSRKIIGFAGRKRSGKSQLAKIVKSHIDKCEIVAVADCLKILCADLLCIDLKTLNKIKDDGTTFSEKVNSAWINIIHNGTGISVDNIKSVIGCKTFTNVREMLQVIGTDLIRRFNHEWHIDKTIEHINSFDDGTTVIVDDIRFPNELEKIKGIGGEVFFVMRPNCFNVSNHKSETSIHYSNFPYNRIIINDVPLDVLDEEFMKCFFEGKESDIILSNNPWYIEHKMGCENVMNKETANNEKFIQEVIRLNKNKPQFVNNGIITFSSKDPNERVLFRQLFMNDYRGSDGCESYSLYNPITNEILKKYI